MACYEDLRALYAATAKERDELKRENAELREICQKQAEMNGRIAAMALGLDEIKDANSRLIEALKRCGDACEFCKWNIGPHNDYCECDCEICKNPCHCNDCLHGSEFLYSFGMVGHEGNSG